MGTPVDELVELLDLEQLEVNLFRGVSPPEDRQRVFGGQVAGQALVAAGRTVSDTAVHSLHAYFLRPGDPRIPIVYEVERTRDGRSFTTRRVVAIQHGKAIFHLQASYHIREEGFDHQAEMPSVAEPEGLLGWAEWAGPLKEKLGAWAERPRPIDVRYLSPPRWCDPSPRPPETFVWIRADGKLPDDPVLHTCVVAYASDLTLLDVSLAPHGASWVDRTVMMASLDHAMWFHRPFRADEWLLYHQRSPSSYGGLGLSQGSIFTRDGQLAVSVVQEGLIRPLRRGD
ncbi:MAG: acyl-CoA thioesterase [Acidimicrobiia bacterium]